MDLRKEFFQNMERIMENDKDVIFITFDLGFSFCESLQKKFPDRFINAGCIEGAGVGIASGMAKAGFKPYVYSGSIFLVCRAYEQIRDDVAYNNLNVKLIGTGASGFLGFTHNFEGKENIEDLLKNLPNLKRFYPQSEKELKKALKINKPSFIKI